MFGMNTTTSTAATPKFSFGSSTAASTPAPGGLTFGTPAPSAAPAGGLTFGSLGQTPASSTTATPGGLTFGAKPAMPSASTGFTLGGASMPASTGFSLGATSTAASPATGFSFGSTPASSAGLTLGGAPTLGGGLNLTTKPAVTSAAVAPTLGTATPLFNLTSSAASTAPLSSAAPTLSLSAPQASTAAAAASTGFSLSTKPATTSTAATSLATSSAAPSLLTSTTTSATTTSTTDSTVPAGTLTYAQLEDAINKWTIDLEDQGKLFANQAKQLNAWDRLLITNGEKILALNNGIERVKQEQHELDQELDFILAQQKELEDLIGPLEKELEMINVTDLDRNNTYQIAENMDSQLKQMSEDLKEIIEQINEENKTQKMSNPITQIGKILNAHMNSLQWIDRNTTKISTQLDHLAKLGDLAKRNEYNLQKSFELTYVAVGFFNILLASQWAG